MAEFDDLQAAERAALEQLRAEMASALAEKQFEEQRRQSEGK